jgi:ribose 5-phosphate isomerase B
VIIAVGSDHAGLELKDQLGKYLADKGYQVQDLGTYTSESVDYPDYGEKVGSVVAAGEAELGICVCGTGIGISIAANKVCGIRAAVVHDVTSARLAKAHNNANVVCFGERMITFEVSRQAIDAFLESSFEGGRHIKRIEKLNNLDKLREGNE